MIIRMVVILCAAVVIDSGCASAPVAHSFEDLPMYVRLGSTLYVTESIGAITQGKLRDLTPITLTLETHHVRRDFAASDIRRIQRSERHLGRDTLIGFGAGLGTGLLIAVATRTDSEGAGLWVIGTTFWGTIAGVITGALVTTHTTVYSALDIENRATRQHGQIREHRAQRARSRQNR